METEKTSNSLRCKGLKDSKNLQHFCNKGVKKGRILPQITASPATQYFLVLGKEKSSKPCGSKDFSWWRLLDSNQWPPACEAGALTSGARRTARNPCCARVSTVLSVPWNLRFYLLEHMRPIMVLYAFRCSGNQMFELNYTSSHIFYRLWRTTNKCGTTLNWNRTSSKRNKGKEYELSLWGVQQYWTPLLL